MKQPPLVNGQTFQQASAGITDRTQLGNLARQFQQVGTPQVKPVPSETLQGTAGLKVPPMPPATGAEGMSAGIEANVKSNQDQYTKNLEEQAKAKEQTMKSSSMDYVSALLGQQGETEQKTNAYAKTVDPIQTELVDINNQINAEIQANRRKVQALEKNPNGLFGGALQDEINRVNNESLAKQADLSVIQMAIQGRYDSAKEIADRAVAVRLEKQKNEIEAKRVAYEDNKELWTKSEQRAFEAAHSDRERQLDKEKALLETISDMKIEAVKGGAGAKELAQLSAIDVSDPKAFDKVLTVGGKYLATAENEIIDINGSKMLVNKRTGAVVKNFGGGSTTPGIVQRTVGGTPVDGYTLVSGDDPYFIAQKYGTDMAGLKALNPKITDWNNIQPGATINVPSKSVGKTQALQTILASGKFTKEQKADLVDAINNGQDPFAVIKNQAKNVMGQTLATDLDKAETAKQQLESIDKAIKAYYAAGGQTGIFTGNYEKTLNKLGNTTDPKLVGLTTEIALAMQAYRLAVTGTAASVKEDVRIDNIFPGISSGEILNNARTQATIGSFNTKIDAAYRNTLGSAYDQLKSTSAPSVDPLTAIQTVDKQNPKLIDTIYSAMPNATTEEVYQYLKSKGYVN